MNHQKTDSSVEWSRDNSPRDQRQDQALLRPKSNRLSVNKHRLLVASADAHHSNDAAAIGDGGKAVGQDQLTIAANDVSDQNTAKQETRQAAHQRSNERKDPAR